jgi:branched-chain amino acid transport system substrate-binding protein
MKPETGVGRRALLAAATALPVLRAARARAQSTTLRIGVLNDMSGNYRDATGPTSAICVRQAVEDFAGHGLSVEVLTGDHQNKPDVGAAIARQWIDRDGVDVIVDVPTSSVALAVNTIVRDKNKVYINSGGATADLTGTQCTPNTVHWSYDTYMLAKTVGEALVKTGGSKWFFITADYVFGQQLQRDTSRFVIAAGGSVAGAAPYPFPSTTDFSSYLLQAQATGANVIGLANAGDDTVNSVKQAHEFGLTQKGVKLAALLGSITVAHALGLETAQGLVITESFYWDLNDRTRAFMQRIKPKTTLYPNAVQAGCYSGVLHYLKAAAAMGPAAAKADGAAAVARMKAMPVDDDAFGQSRLREDGRNLFKAYLFEVKRPAESRGEWDIYKLLSTLPGDDAAIPLSEGKCPLVHV